jgi:superfamily I DNA and/or RNA helicase
MQDKGYKDILTEMLLAVSANIDFLKNNGSSQIYVKDGKLLTVVGGNYLYEFKLGALQDLDPDSEVEIRILKRTYSGKITSATDGKVQISAEEPLGESLASATIVISSYFLLEKLHEHLTSIKDSTSDENYGLSEVIFKTAKNHSGEDSAFLPNFNHSLDASQEDAIKRVLGSDVTFLWGPPGTGKSKTIASLLEEMINRGKSVLLIAHTNAATDSVLEKVVKVVANNPIYLDGKIIRIGSAKTIEPRLQNTMVMPDVILAEKTRPLREEIDSLKKKQESLQAILIKMAAAKADIEELERQNAKVKEAELQYEVLKGESVKVKSLLDEFRDKLKTQDDEIESFQNKKSYQRFLSGTSLDKLTAEKATLVNEVSRLTTQSVSLKESRDKLVETANSLVRNRNLTQKKVEAIDPKYNETEYLSTKQRVAHLTDQVRALEKQIEELADTLIEDAQVIVSTLTKSYMYKPIVSRKFDCVIIDEASMAPQPAIAGVSNLAKEKVVMVGDFFQLPPIAQHNVDRKNKTDEEADLEEKLIDKLLRKDVFYSAGIDGCVRNNELPAEGWLVQLKTQYRMHPDISYLINKLIYGKNGDKFELLNGAPVLNNGNKLLHSTPLSGAHVGIYDTSQLGTVPSKSDSKSTYNLTHALLAVELAKDAISNGYEKVGIISAYRAQVNLINKIIIDELGKNSQVVADTVHRFQGGAKQIVIFDITTPYSNTMYDDTKVDGDDEKLINVAFSRAEEKCLILGDCKVILSKHSESSLIRKSIELCKELGHPLLDASTLLSGYSADDRTEKWLSTLSGIDDHNLEKEILSSKLYDELDFYSNFQKDLISAKEEVIIQSAFLTTSRVINLRPVLGHLISKGLRVFVLTRLAEENSGQMIEESRKAMAILDKMGVIVLPFRGKIHQKYAVIDREILWEGSLNILSQRDSKETMRRFKGEATVSQYMEFHRLDKNIGPLGSNNLSRCDVCKEVGSWMWTTKTAFGYLWTYCLTGYHAKGKPPTTATDRKQKLDDKQNQLSKAADIRKRIKLNQNGKPVCPTHNRILVEKVGRFGDYWECPLRKECACTLSKTQLNKISN